MRACVVDAMQISSRFCKQKPNGRSALNRRSDPVHFRGSRRSFVFSCIFGPFSVADVRTTGSRLKLETFSERLDEEEK
ncbi:hypothetical protein QQF64_029432 [Cirrhinus molitorella]|uniref:Uncharacterized protein n=1 Tax=Cirrhinus molitorella TaxID=172907 RepID=A0ABR3N0K1_9TELE